MKGSSESRPAPNGSSEGDPKQADDLTEGEDKAAATFPELNRTTTAEKKFRCSSFIGSVRKLKRIFKNNLQSNLCIAKLSLDRPGAEAMWYVGSILHNASEVKDFLQTSKSTAMFLENL